jgi:hypothetical protein
MYLPGLRKGVLACPVHSLLSSKAGFTQCKFALSVFRHDTKEFEEQKAQPRKDLCIDKDRHFCLYKRRQKTQRALMHRMRKPERREVFFVCSVFLKINLTKHRKVNSNHHYRHSLVIYRSLGDSLIRGRWVIA